ncbi:uncharacterized oxidoreductase C736.13 [Trichoderma asperellum]|uniref:Uncharacterized oxidoreductase C736.13 n=1 Tax=Trichoderma asperellum TaxID=101201 RepID=A0A6V8R645_TRIAP|nr:uncharacterized oxidoreductase C736.13 [Trichoderma asperellum]
MPRLAGIANFNPEKDIPSLTNRVILVTGGTGGLGEQSIRALAKRGPQHIYFTGRNKKAADAIMNDINAENSGVGLTFLQMDFSSLESISSFATPALWQYRQQNFYQFSHELQRCQTLTCESCV